VAFEATLLPRQVVHRGMLAAERRAAGRRGGTAEKALKKIFMKLKFEFFFHVEFCLGYVYVCVCV
jgi:hypothetical protein